ncbi:MAG: UbiH/UbiF/VisC/COQ6 family ubiquinone biosynthesis hydroxylase [Gammaproteobacteria bacterium]|nr:UbiH/UbiF/VisC/COQ6 family ubiquinone biosynthesis hydroxylase [Gammaproteobacteria bacterium]
MTQYDHDVIIVGAGMVGATLAAALADSGLRIALIEASEPALHWPADSHDLRVSALTIASQRLLTALQAWPAQHGYRISPYHEMRVWDAGGGGDIHFDGADIGADCLGHIVENRVIQAAVLQRVHACPAIAWYCPARIETFTVDAAAVTVVLEDGRRLRAALLVGADGSQSRVRELAGIMTDGWRYDQRAVVATVSTTHPHQQTAWQRFLDNGPLAFLPLADGRSSIVWSTTPEQAAELLALPPPQFCAALTAAFEQRLGTVTATSERAAFALQLQHARYYVGARLALVGDAAHTIHPLAGQGVNLGLLDAATLAEVLCEAWQRQRDIGALAVLRRYERWRKGDTVLTMGVMDGFKRLFGSRQWPVRRVRTAGLQAVDRCAPVKQLLMRRAMGLTGDLPRLARGPWQ